MLLMIICASRACSFNLSLPTGTIADEEDLCLRLPRLRFLRVLGVLLRGSSWVSRLVVGESTCGLSIDMSSGWWSSSVSSSWCFELVVVVVIVVDKEGRKSTSLRLSTGAVLVVVVVIENGIRSEWPASDWPTGLKGVVG